MSTIMEVSSETVARFTLMQKREPKQVEKREREEGIAIRLLIKRKNKIRIEEKFMERKKMYNSKCQRANMEMEMELGDKMCDGTLLITGGM
jgi:hypothetical protein